MTAQIDSGTRQRLAKLLGMIGSAFDGEALAAARKAEALRQATGATWGQLLTVGDDLVIFKRASATRKAGATRTASARRKKPSRPKPNGHAAGPQPDPWAAAATPEAGVKACLRWRQHLTDWEFEFMQSVLRQRALRGSFTEKQFAVIERIGKKVDAAIRKAASA